jgi:predicted acylesterase/phospholipase RssA
MAVNAEPEAPQLPSRDETRARDVAHAQLILRGTAANAGVVYALAERLKDVNEFGYARRLYARLRAAGNYGGISATPVKVGQRHALGTYKDPDLPAAERFKWALEILTDVDLHNPTPDERQESAGLRGAIYKRKWQVEGQRSDLDRALGHYLKGYEMGPEHDQGYTGINAAFVLDLLAREDAVEAKRAGTRGVVDRSFWERARTIRRELAKLLPGLPAVPGNAWLRSQWWFYTTRAEAHFGLGEYDEAVAALRAYNAAVGIAHGGPPLERIAPWEFETFVSQLASLADLQADLVEMLGDATAAATALDLRRRARQALRGYLGDLTPGVDRAISGKVGLALSGGGFRASLFHIGVLAHLAERDVLRRVEVLSCVSGGSIVGAHYYLEVQRLLEQKADGEITREDYVELVRRLERDFLAGVQTNIRSRVFGSVWANLRMFFQPGYSTTQRLGDLYEEKLYAQVADGREDAPRYLPDLLVRPKGEPSGFKPKYDNWRRAAKVPMLVLNATTLNTGHNWQFTASWMGEPPSTLDAEIEGNYRLRRMYHPEAPRLADQWRGSLGRLLGYPDYQRFRLGHAVAASSCVPGLFDPLVMADLYDGKTIRLVDGGVYDNQGVASLLEQDCNVMIVSDASGQMAAQDQPSSGRLGVPLRCFSVSMARVRQAEFQELDARRRSGLLKGLMFLHLQKDLDADPVDWRECQDPHDASDEARPASRRGVLTSYGIQKSVQRLLSGIRTDLDSFTEVEAFALMTSGYRQAQQESELLDGLSEAVPPRDGWRFLDIEPVLHPGPGFDDLTKQLRIGGLTPGKVWMLSPVLTVAGILIALAGVAGLGWLAWTYRSTSLVTVKGLAVFLIVLGAMAIVPHLVRIIRYGRTFSDFGLRCLVAAVLAVGFKIHLRVFDPIFLRRGRAARLLALRQPSSP